MSGGLAFEGGVARISNDIFYNMGATVKISEDQFSREGLKMTSDMHETL